VLDVAQEQVGLGHLGGAPGGQIAERIEIPERRERRSFAQAPIASAIDQRQRLHDEFELANAAVAELDITMNRVGGAQLLLDLAFHRAQLPQRVEVEIVPVDEMFQLRQQPAAQIEVAPRRTRP
jgi:hypothetical protein